MKFQKILIISWIFLLTLGSLRLVPNNDTTNILSEKSLEATPEIKYNEEKIDSPKPASFGNDEDIQHIFTDKLNQFNDLGYFEQRYKSSLQATYYTLFILESIGRLNEINQTAILDYIMSHYNTSSHQFLDIYALRYLDTDYYDNYYPLSTLLEVNCYAILSLKILNKLNLIDTQKSINFIWSCYNPETSGFIGQSYSPLLHYWCKLSTMDNTYYAIMTLNLLMNDWGGYTSEKITLIDYVLGLQANDPRFSYFGGFLNDYNKSLNSLYMFEPNLLTCYYCIKSLKVFDLVNMIRIADFHQFFGDLYNESESYFRMANLVFPENDLNIIATALALELSDLTGFTSIYRAAIINFLLINRNPQGIWPASSYYDTYEIMDTFYVINSFRNSGVISQLNIIERQLICTALNSFNQDNHGYSPISKDYTSLKLIHTIVNSFDFFNRTSELDLQWISEKVKNCFYFDANLNCYKTFAYINRIISFQSYPIEYFSRCAHNLIEEIDREHSHKTTYMALEILQKLSKLPDLETDVSFYRLKDEIINCQFLNWGINNSGGFLPYLAYTYLPIQPQIKSIFLENTYYAIKSLEILASYLKLGSITNLGINKSALLNYILQHKEENSSRIYFDPYYTKNVETILQNTYFMIYVLKALDLYKLPNYKFENLILQTIDYSNIKNLYYCYKISDLLNLYIEFDLDATHSLVQDIFSEKYREYFLSLKKDIIDQEILIWICEMAKDQTVRTKVQYLNSLSLGSSNEISVFLCNLILDDLSDNMMVWFESTQLGNYILEKQIDKSYKKDIYIPVISENYPIIKGKICIYQNSLKLKELPITFNTTYEVGIKHITNKLPEKINIDINISLILANGSRNLSNSEIYTKTSKNYEYLETIYFHHHDYLTYSAFSLEYLPSEMAVYLFEVFLDDSIQYGSIKILNEIYIKNDTNPDPPPIINSTTKENTSEDSSDSIIAEYIHLENMILLGIIGITAILACSSVAVYIVKGKSKINLNGNMQGIIENEKNKIETQRQNDKNSEYIGNLSASIFDNFDD